MGEDRSHSLALQDGNDIGDRGAEMIAEGLKGNSTLQQLYLVRLFRALFFSFFCKNILWSDDASFCVF